MARWLYFVIPTAIGAIVGGTYYGVTEAAPLSVVFGLLTVIVFFVLGETRRICSKFEKKVNTWELKVLDLQHLMTYLEQPDPYVEEQVQVVLSELRNLTKSTEILKFDARIVDLPEGVSLYEAWLKSDGSDDFSFEDYCAIINSQSVKGKSQLAGQAILRCAELYPSKSAERLDEIVRNLASQYGDRTLYDQFKVITDRS